MPTKARREDLFIRSFLSAYEDDSWADAELCWLDQKMDGAVDMLATRRSDGHTLAIEHTLLQPFVGEKRDFAQFVRVFPRIACDQSLAIPERLTRVFIPVGTLDGQKPAAVEAFVKAVHGWLRANRLSIQDGKSQHRCLVPEMPGVPTCEITLTIKVSRLRKGSPGTLQIERQQINNDFSKILGKALTDKLPKLVATCAKKRILILERQHINLTPDLILEEIRKQRSAFPKLSKVDEIWMLETMAYESERYFDFYLYNNNEDDEIANLLFHGETLILRTKYGWLVPI